MPGIELPHGPEARLVTRTLDEADGRIVCEAVLPGDSPWRTAAGFPSFVAIEAAAQAAALLPGSAAGSRAGSLVRVRSLVCSRAWLRADAPFRVAVARAPSAPPLFVFDVEVVDSGGPILSGRIGLYLEGGEAFSGHISAKQNH
jgi:hypothetical protein